MITCPSCNHQEMSDEVMFCANCGLRMSGESVQPSASDRLKLWGGESRILSVFFVGFKGFEQLADEHSDFDIMLRVRECMTEIADIIKSFDGTSDLIIPDSRVLGIFGAPKAHQDDPLRVLRCAWQIKNWWRKKKEKSELLGDVKLTMGVNTGRAFFGYILEEFSFLTVIGDAINTAARLAEISPPNEILMSESTYNRVAEYVDAEHVGERSVKGKTAKIHVYLIKELQEESKIVVSPKIPFFGREEELNRLMDIARGLNDMKAKLCIITGQMGIGKTRLKEEFENYISQDNSLNYIETHCSVEIQSPYYPFKFLLRRYFDLNEFDSKEVTTNKINDGIIQKGLSPINAKGLRHLFLTDLKRLKHDEMLSINEEIYASIKNLIKHECQNCPLILIFEEFNKADEMSKYLVAYLISELKNEPIMFLMVNVSKEFITNIDANIDEINVRPLSQKDIKDLVGFMLKDVDDKLIDFMYKSAGGNPLFTIEAVRNTKRSKLIKKVSGRWVLEKEQRLPFLDDLYGVVMSTIDSLPSNHRLVVDFASVIGYSFSLRILEGLLESTNLNEQLNYLVEEGYIIQSKDDKDPVYVFRHNLLKDAAYTVLPLRKRKEIHQLVATLFEKTYVNQLSDFYEDVGHHYLACENFRKAANYIKLSGDKAKNLYALDQAKQFYQTVLKLDKDTKNQVGTDLVRESLLNLADIYEITSDITRMIRIADQGLQSARQNKDFESEIHFTERYAHALFLINKLTEAEELLLTGVEQCGEKMPDVLSILYSDLGILYQAKGEYEKSILHYNLSWNTARAHSIKKGELLCLHNLSQLHRSLGNYEQALEYLQYGLDELMSEDDLRWRVLFKYIIAGINHQVGHLEKARELLLDCFKISDEIGSVESYLKSALDLAVIYANNGESEKAQEYLQRADEKVSFLIRENLLSEINLKKAMVFHHESDYQKAQDYITGALKIAQKFRQRELEFWCYNVLSLIDTKSAFDHGKEALRIAEKMKLQPLIAIALYRMTQLHIQDDDFERARYYGRKALLVFDDLKYRLTDEHREFFSRRPEYLKLLEL